MCIGGSFEQVDDVANVAYAVENVKLFKNASFCDSSGNSQPYLYIMLFGITRCNMVCDIYSNKHGTMVIYGKCLGEVFFFFFFLNTKCYRKCGKKKIAVLNHSYAFKRGILKEL